LTPDNLSMVNAALAFEDEAVGISAQHVSVGGM
jgi:hypothetical protein